MKERSRFSHLFRALSSRNYRLFFVGQGISLVGTWMQNVAQAWLVYKMTNSVFLLGIVGFLGQIMVFILSPVAGVIADRVNRHRLLIITQTLALVQAFVLAAMVLTHTIQVWHIMVLSLLLGVINSFDMPVRQSFVIEMVEKKEDLANAIALNSSLVNSARLLGPSIAGLLIALFGEGMCFLLNGISYIAVIFSLLMMKLTRKMNKKHDTKVLHEIKAGMSYAYNFHPIRYLLILLAFISLIGGPYTVLMPVMAKDLLHGGPQTMGWLMSSSGCGALLGALYLASKRNVTGLLSMIVNAAVIFGGGLFAVSFSSVTWVSCFLLFITGFGMVTQMASSNTILQTITDEDKRGRVMSLFAMAFIGMAPLGSLYAGTVAHLIGARPTLALSGILCIISGLLFRTRLPAMRKLIRPIYIKMGIIPEVARAIDTVSDIEVIADKE